MDVSSKKVNEKIMRNARRVSSCLREILRDVICVTIWNKEYRIFSFQMRNMNGGGLCEFTNDDE